MNARWELFAALGIYRHIFNEGRLMTPRIVRNTLIVSLTLVVLTACGSIFPPNAAPGTAAADVRARYGAPSDERSLANGTRVWDYVHGPQGFQTYRVTFDSANRVQGVEQLLTEKNFLNIRAGETTREDLTRMYGRPGGVVRYPNLGTEVWTYRYRDVTLEMLNDVHFNASTGRVLYYSMYRDPAYTSAMDY